MWKVEYSKDSIKTLKKLNHHIIKFIQNKIKNVTDWLNNKADLTIDLKKLKGDWEGYYRIRAGRLRIIISFLEEERIVRIHLIDFRGDVYK